MLFSSTLVDFFSLKLSLSQFQADSGRYFLTFTFKPLVLTNDILIFLQILCLWYYQLWKVRMLQKEGNIQKVQKTCLNILFLIENYTEAYLHRYGSAKQEILQHAFIGRSYLLGWPSLCGARKLLMTSSDSIQGFNGVKTQLLNHSLGYRRLPENKNSSMCLLEMRETMRLHELGANT